MAYKCDKFDSDYLNIPVEKLDTGNRPKSTNSAEAFVKFPLAWRTPLRDARNIATIWLALFLQYETWKNHGGPVVVSNSALKDWGNLSTLARCFGG